MNRAERLIKLKEIHRNLLTRQKIDRLEEQEEREESSLSFSNFGLWVEDGLIKGH